MIAITLDQIDKIMFKFHLEDEEISLTPYQNLWVNNQNVFQGLPLTDSTLIEVSSPVYHPQTRANNKNKDYEV